MTFIKNSVESGLDLTVHGSVGSFKIRKSNGGGNESVKVKYILSHVAFRLDGSHEDKLLKNLVPFRETFEVNELEFDQILQRDIDDSRVATSLIPYLLGEDSSGKVKIFPPIVVALLPMEEGKLADWYPEVKETVEPEPQNPRIRWHLQQSGEPGKEVFAFRQMSNDGKISAHDYAELKINSATSNLVIVDGQHRAMALLALHRNIKSWPDKASSYKSYYGIWSRKKLEGYDFSEISLPVMICTFPELDGTGTDVKVFEACRNIFLSLNKNAKPVSRSRNYLLDDNDIISLFLRDVLSEIKQNDVVGGAPLRLWNVELDAGQDRQSLSSPMALTGTMHLHFLIENWMLNPLDFSGLKSKRHHLSATYRLTHALRRLGATDKLGKQAAESTTRNAFSRPSADVLRNQFKQIYGSRIVFGLERFRPYWAHCKASSEVEKAVKQNVPEIHAVLFQGQGMARVFNDYLDKLSTKSKESKSVPKELDDTLRVFRDQRAQMEKYIAEFKKKRVARLLALNDNELEDKLTNRAISALTEQFDSTFTTSAFQASLFLSFFHMLEQFAGKQGVPSPADATIPVSELFEEYLDAVNRIFPTPSDNAKQKAAKAQKLLELFVGRVQKDGSRIDVVASSGNLRQLLVPGELKPDLWTRFRYLFLELWKTESAELGELIEHERKLVRQWLLRDLINRNIRVHCQTEGIDESELTTEVQRKIREDSWEQFKDAHTPLDVKIREKDFRDHLHGEGMTTDGDDDEIDGEE